MKRTAKWVYMIQAGNDGPVKIGSAVDVGQRLAQMQGASVELLHLRAAIPGNMKTEKELHRRFSKYRLRGEWFQLAPEIIEIIEGADTSKYPGTIIKRHVGERMAPDEAFMFWADVSMTTVQALEKMPGWNFHQAYGQFGARGADKLKSERAKEMAKTRWERAEPGVVELWQSPHMADDLKRWGAVWRDPIYRNDREAFAAMSDEVQQQVSSPFTARKIFGHRRPGQKAGGRPKKPRS